MRIEDVLKELRKEMTIIRDEFDAAGAAPGEPNDVLVERRIVEVDSNDVMFSDNPQNRNLRHERNLSDE